MQYKLRCKEQKYNDEVYNLLYGRGIDNPKLYMNLDNSCIIPYNKLSNMDKAVELFVKHYENEDMISILCDSDVDGYTSASSMYSYIKRLNEDYPVNYILHGDPKSHGLGKDVIIPEGTKLLILPDAGTNDYEECKRLIEKGIDILILDHHEAEENGWKNTEQCIIVNNQMSKDYSNKDLSGVGIVYKFLQALDEELWVEYADDFLDLVALGNISDVMDMRSYETKKLVCDGLKNIHNKLFIAMINAQEFSMKGIVNIHTIQFYITPIINACIRVGTSEEKELVFKAFIEQDEFFDYKKRGGEAIKESIYDRAARLCKNDKSRQDKMRDKAFNTIISQADSVVENKVAIFDVSDILSDRGLTGLVAIKVAEKLNKPCLLLKKYTKDNEVLLGGSARNIDNSPIESLKDILNETGAFEFAQGHANACGLSIKQENVVKANAALNKMLEGIKYDSTYSVDYILQSEEIDYNLCYDLDGFDDLIGQGVPEPLVAIENLYIKKEQCSMFGKTTNTIKIDNGSGVEYIQFFCKEGQVLYDWLNNSWDNEDYLIVNLIGTPGINEYNNIKTPQIVIKDIEVIDRGVNDNVNDEDDDIW